MNETTSAEIYFLMFMEACRVGDLKTVQQLYSEHDVVGTRVSDDNVTVFQHVCFFGHLNIAKWLLFVQPSIDIAANNDEAYRSARTCGHTHIVDWFHSLNPNKY